MEALKATQSCCSNLLETSLYGSTLVRTAKASSSRRKKDLSGLTIIAQASKRRVPTSRTGQRMQMQQQMQQRTMPKMPAPEDDNPRFVIFIRSKNVPLWYPLNIVSGGTAAKFLVGVVKNKLGKVVYGESLTRNIAGAVYKDEKAIVMSVKKKFSTLRDAKEFLFGYKIVDESKPEDALRPVDITLIPAKEDIKPITEKVSDLVGKGMDNLKDSLGLRADNEDRKAP